MPTDHNVAEPAFDREVGVSLADAEAAIRVADAYIAVRDEYAQFSQYWNESNGRWEDRYNYVTGNDFVGVDENGDGVFEDRDRDKGSIPLAFLTTPRAQWVAEWEAKKWAKIDEYATQLREAAEAKAAREAQQAREEHLKEVTLDRAAERAILDPGFITDRGDGESTEAWQARAVRVALAAPMADLTWALGS
jgi:hypothetical protein